MLNVDAVIAMHDMLIAREGGLLGDHGIAAIEGALGRVISRIMYEGVADVYEIAAMYAVAISRGHTFNDANKRTALLAALTYLDMQSIEIPISPALEEITVDVAQGLIDCEDLAHMLYLLAQE